LDAFKHHPALRNGTRTEPLSYLMIGHRVGDLARQVTHSTMLLLPEYAGETAYYLFSMAGLADVRPLGDKEGKPIWEMSNAVATGAFDLATDVRARQQARLAIAA
jgi:hypothetical protein